MPCSAGQFSSASASIRCANCAAKTFSPNPGASACDACPLFSTASQSFVACTCDSGMLYMSVISDDCILDTLIDLSCFSIIESQTRFWNKQSCLSYALSVIICWVRCTACTRLCIIFRHQTAKQFWQQNLICWFSFLMLECLLINSHSTKCPLPFANSFTHKGEYQP